jgi:hypothetical protein
MKIINKYYKLPSFERKMFIQACLISLEVKVMTSIFPIRYYNRFLTRRIPEKSINPELIHILSKALIRCKRHFPIRTKCLEEAITGKFLLRKYGISSTLYLGVCKENEEKLVAHAWLSSDDQIITGGRGYEKFTIVSSFA